jgi:hypothetical protein
MGTELLTRTAKVDAAREMLLRAARRGITASAMNRWNELLDIDFTDLVRAYVTLHELAFEEKDIAQNLVARTASANLANVVFPAVAAVLSEQPCDEVGIAQVVVSTMRARAKLQLLSDIPGLFRRDVYSALFGGVEQWSHGDVSTSHAEYLVQRLGEEESALTLDERALGKALAPEWEGTLASLIDTAKRLAT